MKLKLDENKLRESPAQVKVISTAKSGNYRYSEDAVHPKSGGTRSVQHEVPSSGKLVVKTSRRTKRK